jgi:hypothetical protein
MVSSGEQGPRQTDQPFGPMLVAVLLLLAGGYASLKPGSRRRAGPADRHGCWRRLISADPPSAGLPGALSRARAQNPPHPPGGIAP